MSKCAVIVVLSGWMVTAAPAQDSPLAGPSVQEDRAAPTLVTRAFDGSVALPDSTLEEAAVALLGLDAMGADEATAAAAEAVRAIFTRRAKALEDFVFDNLDLLVQLDAAGNTGNKLDQLHLLARGFRELKPLREAGPLADQVRRALPHEHALRFNALMSEYWNALVADRTWRAKPDGKYPSRLEALAGTRLELLGKEVERSFQRLISSGEFVYRVATRDITLRPEQARRLREAIEEHYRMTGGNDDEQANRRLFMRASAILDEEQRPRFFRNLQGIGRPKRKPEPAPEPE
jgi:hypothetical protein